MVIMSELHRKIIRTKLRKMEFDIDLFAREVEIFAQDSLNFPIPELAKNTIKDCIKMLRKPLLSDDGKTDDIDANGEPNSNDEEEDAALVQERLAKELASLIRETFPSNNLRRVAALTICYQLGMPNSTRILFGLCSPLPQKRNINKRRNRPIIKLAVK